MSKFHFVSTCIFLTLPLTYLIESRRNEIISFFLTITKSITFISKMDYSKSNNMGFFYSVIA